MARRRIPKKIKDELLVKCMGRCCICHFPIVQINHLDGNAANNDPDNLIPLCPNCHALTHTRQHMTQNITADQLKLYRDRWFAACAVAPAVAVQPSQPLQIVVLPALKAVGEDQNAAN